MLFSLAGVGLWPVAAWGVTGGRAPTARVGCPVGSPTIDVVARSASVVVYLHAVPDGQSSSAQLLKGCAVKTGRRVVLDETVGDDGFGGIVTVDSVRVAGATVAYLRGCDDRGIGANQSVFLVDLAAQKAARLSAAVDSYDARGAVRGLRVSARGRVAWVQQRAGGPGAPGVGVQAWTGRTIRTLDDATRVSRRELTPSGATWSSGGRPRKATFAPVSGSAAPRPFG